MAKILPFGSPAAVRADREKDSLSGLAGIIVVPHAASAPLSEEDLRAEAESLLEEAGVATFTETDADALPYAGCLGITFQTLPAGESAAYFLHLELVQTVRLLRPGGRRLLAVTWSTSRSGVAAGQQAAAAIRKALRGGLAEFVRDLAEANEKKAP